MTIEAIPEHRTDQIIRHMKRVGYAGRRVVDTKRCCKKKLKRSPPPPHHLPSVSSLLQNLFQSCKHVFKGPATVPLPPDVNTLCRILDNMKAEDVGLSSKLHFFNPNKAAVVVQGTVPRVCYTTIYKCTNFSMCIFFLPAGGVIPLHNHPQMTVFSKLLLGRVHIKSYDLVSCPCDASPFHRLAKLVADEDYSAPCDTSVLYPTTGGNIHQFTALTPCAILDVLGPPYSVEDGRDCSYYRDFAYQVFSEYGWLEEVEMPENSEMDGIEYLGPQVV
ncbi:Plant cysteine oxidase 2 [Linum perenne]